jgi:hypothetical protein
MKCSYSGIEFQDHSDGIWDDGEWISWDYLSQFIDDDETAESEGNEESEDVLERASPSTLQLWELIDELTEMAKRYQEVTGRHLPIYGELGELYGEAKFGIKRHRPMAQGSDGRLGNDLVEIKTISPGKNSDVVFVKRSGNFSKLLIVKISDRFEFAAKMIDRKSLGKGQGKFAKAKWESDEVKYGLVISCSCVDLM